MNKKAIISIIALGLALSISASEELSRPEQVVRDQFAYDRDFEEIKGSSSPDRRRRVSKRSNNSIIEVPYEEYKAMCDIIRNEIARQTVIEKFLQPKPKPVVLSSFKKAPVKLLIMMPSYYYEYPSSLEGIAELNERREIALQEKLISDEIDCEHTIVYARRAYGFEKNDKEFFLVHPRLFRESTDKWLQRLRDKRFADTNNASSSNTISTNSDEKLERRASFEELYTEIEYPTLVRVDMPDSEEIAWSFQGIEGNPGADSSIHDTIPSLSSDSIVSSDHIVQISVKDQLLAYKEKIDEESPSLFSTKTKVAVGLAATLAYGYFCYTRNRVVRTKK